MRPRFPLLALAALAILFLMSVWSPVLAANTGSLQVSVTDPNGAPVEGATLVVTDPTSPAFRQTATTDRKGRATIIGLVPRDYNFRVEKEGTQTYESNFTAHAGGTERKDVKILALGGGSTGAPVKGETVVKKKDPWAVSFNEAIPLYQEDKDEEALAHLDAALQAKADYAPALMLKGIILEEHSKCDEAIPLLRQAWAVDPNTSKSALGPLVRCLERSGLKDEAEAFRKQQATFGQSKTDLYNEAVSRINAGDDTGAASLLEQALKIDERFAAAQYQYGLILFRRGEIPNAVTRLETYLKLAPSGEFAADAKDLLKALKP